MMKYARIVDEDTRRCEVGIGTDDEFYISIGMELMDVEEAYDGNWYVSGYVPEPVYTTDDYDRAMEEYLLAVRSARGYTLREPSPTYDDSPNERWASDARDWKIFFTAVMEYGLSVINEYQRTGIAPTLEEFKNNLPNIVWSYE